MLFVVGMLNLGVETKKKKMWAGYPAFGHIIKFGRTFLFFEASALDDFSALNPCNGWKTMNFLLVSHPSKPIVHQISATPCNIQSKYRKPFSHSPECEGKNCTLGELPLTMVPLGTPQSYFCVR
jgi:hypothetical protein